jgi:predicted branched-subunit amino acid permease
LPSGGPAASFKSDFGTPRGALRAGMREAVGAPLLVLFASYVGFGSLVRESRMSLPAGLLSTIATWALPGQIVSVELYAAGTSLATIFIAVALTNARMMPMTMTLLPLVRMKGRARWRLFVASHLIAVTGWAVAMMRCPDMPPAQRLSYFVGFAATLLCGSMIGTAVGFLASGAVPSALSLGLVFVNPVDFMLLFLGERLARPGPRTGARVWRRLGAGRPYHRTDLGAADHRGRRRRVGLHAGAGQAAWCLTRISGASRSSSPAPSRR